LKLFIVSSDADVSSLTSIDAPDFDAARLDGVTASVLHDLMNLTFISDEKVASNPLYPPKRVPPASQTPPATTSPVMPDGSSLDVIIIIIYIFIFRDIIDRKNNSKLLLRYTATSKASSHNEKIVL